MKHDRWHWFARGVVLGLLIGAVIAGGYFIPKLSKAHEEMQATTRAAQAAAQDMQHELSRRADEYREAVRQREEAEKALYVLKNPKKDKQDSPSMLAFLVDFFSGGKPAAALPLPAVGEVDRLILRRRNESVSREVILNDAGRIERLLVFLAARNDGWRKPLDTFPAGDWTISLQKGNECVLVLWVGQNFLAGCEGRSGSDNNRLRSLSVKDREELSRILGLSMK